MADSKACQVRHERGGVLEPESLVKLQAIGGDRHDERRTPGDAALGHHLGKRGDTRLGAPALERERQLAPPVRVLVDGARQVRLLEHLEHVLGLQHGELGRRAGDERMRRAGRQVQSFAFKRGFELSLFRLTHREFFLDINGETKLLPKLEVVRVPVAAPGRQVVRRDAHQRLARIGARRAVLAGRILLEEQRPVGKQPGLVERRAHLGRHRAQVLADHQAARAAALGGEDREQLAERIVDVAAALGLRALRDPPQARQRHDVVHAQRPAHRHVGAQEIDERLVGLGAQRARRIGRQAPVLAARIELVGRRAAGGTDRERILVRPQLRAAAIGAEREVHVEPERHAEVARPALRVLELPARGPLQPGVERHTSGIFPGESCDLF